MNVHRTIVPPLPALTRDEEKPVHLATALDQVQKMVDDLTDAQVIIAQLKADLHREQDLVALLVEERNKYRREALTFRDKLVELATIQSNVNLMTVAATEIVRVVHELTSTDVNDTSLDGDPKDNRPDGNTAA